MFKAENYIHAGLAMLVYWFAEETFKIISLLFQELYTIHVVKCNGIVPALIALKCPNCQHYVSKGNGEYETGDKFQNNIDFE